MIESTPRYSRRRINDRLPINRGRKRQVVQRARCSIGDEMDRRGLVRRLDSGDADDSCPFSAGLLTEVERARADAEVDRRTYAAAAENYRRHPILCAVVQ